MELSEFLHIKNNLTSRKRFINAVRSLAVNEAFSVIPSAEQSFLPYTFHPGNQFRIVGSFLKAICGRKTLLKSSILLYSSLNTFTSMSIV